MQKLSYGLISYTKVNIRTNFKVSMGGCHLKFLSLFLI